MADKKVTEPSQLQGEWALLDQAVNRLEAAQTALATKVEQQLKTAPNNQGETASLQEENRALREVNDAVSKRLDGVIDRLKSVLEV